MKKYTILVFVMIISCCSNKIDAQKKTQSHQELTNDTPIIVTHELWNVLLQKHVSENGNVDYNGLKNNYSELKTYLDLLSSAIPNESQSRDYKLAYWINTYNALTVDLIIKNYPLESIKDIKNPWEQRLWKLGNKNYNLEEIEHEILRKMSEPRIHFAIVCASASCPKLLNEAFVPEKLDQQLTLVTKGFLADTKRNIIKPNKLEISKIFKWFDDDFKQNGSLIDFLNTYSDTKISSDAKINYLDYSWELND